MTPAPRAYYNENDPFAAAWLRNLIAAGHVAPGDVDERSITEVRPSDLDGYTQHHFFAGIGIWSLALRLAGWPDTERAWTGSCPCQSFSAAGQRRGFDDHRHLWPDWFRLIRECRPLTIFGEQVASKDALAWLDLVHADLEGAGYAVGAVDTCAAGFGAPHIRQRLYWVADSQQRGGYDGRGLHGRRVEESEWREAPIGSESRQQVEGNGSANGLADSAAARFAGTEITGANYDNACERIRGIESERVGSNGSMAHPNGRQPCDCRIQRSGEYGLGSENGGAGGMAYAESQRDGSGDARTRRRGESSDGGELGDANATRPQGRLFSGNSAYKLSIGASSVAGRLELSEGLGGQDGTSESERPRRLTSTSYWSDCSWLPCIDRRARPVEPGTFPLAHGYPNRVGTLRGYGNALVAPQAAAFIEAYLDVRQEKS